MPKISQKRNVPVTFRCYDPGGNGAGFYEWYDSVPDAVRAEIDVVLETLANSPRPWPEQLFKPLRKDLFGLSEVRVEIPLPGDQKPDQYRILACAGPDDDEVTLLAGFKKENTSDYSAPGHQALQRKGKIKRDAKRARIFPVP